MDRHLQRDARQTAGRFGPCVATSITWLEALLDGRNVGRERRLDPEKLHVRFLSGAAPEGPIVPRCYTLTHSDRTGELFLTIGPEHDREQMSGWHRRLLRDEVLAEWRDEEDRAALHIHCHVSGGLVLGPAGWRYAILRRELPLVLETLRFGDGVLFKAHPALDQAPLAVMSAKEVIHYCRDKSIADGLDYVAQRSANILPSDDFFEAIAAFGEKRTAA